MKSVWFDREFKQVHKVSNKSNFVAINFVENIAYLKF